MPRNVRNFWLEARIDGIKNDIGTGGAARDAGMDITLRYREDGGIADETIDIRCSSNGEKNRIVVRECGKIIFDKEVLR